MKRGIDVMGSLMLLGTLSWLLVLLALLVKVSSRGPVVFRQMRSGLNGKPFMIFKFRTLQASAGITLDADGKEQQVGRGDPRVTVVGRWLRRSGLDELPQLVNVLRGDMSLVGPRPHVPSHDEFYGRRIRDYWGRYEVRPGITGWAQIHGLTQETPTVAHMVRRVRFDRDYVTQQTMRMDLKILLATPLAVFWPLKSTGQKAFPKVKKQAVIS